MPASRLAHLISEGQTDTVKRFTIGEVDMPGRSPGTWGVNQSLQRRAQLVNHDSDCHKETERNKDVFNCRRASFVSKKANNWFFHKSAPSNAYLPIRNFKRQSWQKHADPCRQGN